LLDKEPPEEGYFSGKKFVTQLIEDHLGHLPFGTLAAGHIKRAIGEEAWNDLDPDAILFAGPGMLAQSISDFRQAYKKYFEGKPDEAEIKLFDAIQNLYDGIARLRGLPASGIMDITTRKISKAAKQPPASEVEKALRADERKRRNEQKVPEPPK